MQTELPAVDGGVWEMSIATQQTGYSYVQGQTEAARERVERVLGGGGSMVQFACWSAGRSELPCGGEGVALGAGVPCPSSERPQLLASPEKPGTVLKDCGGLHGLQLQAVENKTLGCKYSIPVCIGFFFFPP